MEYSADAVGSFFFSVLRSSMGGVAYVTVFNSSIVKHEKTEYSADEVGSNPGP